MLSANVVLETKKSPLEVDLKVVDGVIEIFQGAFLTYESGNIGYVQLGTDAISQEFAGIAMEHKTIAAADNTSDGTYDIRTLTRGCGKIVKMTTTSTITIANEGDPVYVDGDDAVDVSSGIANTTGGFVGIIRQFISGNLAWVQMTQHPTL